MVELRNSQVSNSNFSNLIKYIYIYYISKVEWNVEMQKNTSNDLISYMLSHKWTINALF